MRSLVLYYELKDGTRDYCYENPELVEEFRQKGELESCSMVEFDVDHDPTKDFGYFRMDFSIVDQYGLASWSYWKFQEFLKTGNPDLLKIKYF